MLQIMSPDELELLKNATPLKEGYLINIAAQKLWQRKRQIPHGWEYVDHGDDKDVVYSPQSVTAMCALLRKWGVSNNDI